MVNNDPRYLETKRILNEIDGLRPVKLYKVTRAGATTGLSANAIDAKQRFVLFAPTKEIAHKTIKDSIKYANKADANIKLLLSNHSCLKNKAMVEEYPDVGNIPILPLPSKCEDCDHFRRCPVTDFIRSRVGDIDGVGLTYQKLMAIMFSDSKAAETMKRRLSSAKVFIFDEAHNYETPDVVSIEMYPHRDLDKYRKLFKKNKKISPFLERFAELKHRLELPMMELIHAKDDSLKNRMAIDLKDIDALAFKHTVKALKAVIEVMKHRNDYGLSIDDVLFIFDVIMVLSTDRLVLHYIKTDEGGSVHLSGKDGIYKSTKLFLGMLDPDKKKKVIFTSATFGDYDYTSIFGFHDQLMMPDAMRSNEKMTIYPDSFKLDTINYNKRYYETIIDVVEMYEKKFPGIRFVCMKKNVAFWLYYRLVDRGHKINIDYYRSDRTLGVASDERRCVCVGAPTAPINVFDGAADTFEQSQKRRIDNNHAAFWQAISRFKDPSGVDESHVYCIGITEDEIRKMIKWGIGRKLYMNGTVCKRVEVRMIGGTSREIEKKIAMQPATPSIFSKNRSRVIKMIKRYKNISRGDLYSRLRIKADELNEILLSLNNDGLIKNDVVKTKTKPVHFYSMVVDSRGQST